LPRYFSISSNDINLNICTTKGREKRDLSCDGVSALRGTGDDGGELGSNRRAVTHRVHFGDDKFPLNWIQRVQKTLKYNW